VYRGPGLGAFIYLVVGILVAAGVIGDQNYLSDVNTFKEVIDAILAVLLWPLVLLGVHFHVGGGGKGK
jgi:succinate dehydrogenase/fumarate reductase cytochrome b subunit